ncbi:hypothetical protein NP493_1099g00008 [Ridgeia piscesae]|uniref:Uncharacterized protein n=1 Tax=Ridgeia piscesae TaxID=27915 RepID=A0AAD9KGX3_RIDPI|nr:hypothetical protein NP493_1099g00008 [Ridgeia piscesae]
MGAFWCLQVLPLSVTALMPVIVVPLFGIQSAKDVIHNYMRDVIMVFACSLMIAVAIEKSGIHRRLAIYILMQVGGQPKWITLGFMLPTWFLSMWITNTATTAMVMPIAEAVLRELEAPVEKVTEPEPVVEAETVMMYTWSEHNGGVIMDPLSTDQLTRIQRKKPTSPVARTTREMPRQSGEADDITLNTEGTEGGSWYEVNLSTASINGKEGFRSREGDIAKSVILSVAYAANIGGIATLIGTPANLILKENADAMWKSAHLPSPVEFLPWMAFSLPISAIMLFLMWVWSSPPPSSSGSPAPDHRREEMMVKFLKEERDRIGAITFAEVMTVVLFVIMILLLFTRHPMFMPGWAEYFKPGYVDDDCAMMLIVFAMFLIPANTPHTDILTARQSTPDTLLDWETMRTRFPWGFIFVLGGAYALADACAVSGLSLWIGKRLVISSLPDIAMVMVLSLLTAAFTELASNTAVTTILMPIVGCMAIDLGKNPLYLMLPVAVTTSFSFMFPVSSPPNAIAFATGRLRVVDMVKAGCVPPLLCVVTVALATQTWGMALFGLSSVPWKNATVLSDSGACWEFFKVHGGE